MFNPVSKVNWVYVSGPYRGMGGVLLKLRDAKTEEEQFPAPLEVWVGSYGATGQAINTYPWKFPAPREVWVGSYKQSKLL